MYSIRMCVCVCYQDFHDGRDDHEKGLLEHPPLVDDVPTCSHHLFWGLFVAMFDYWTVAFFEVAVKSSSMRVYKIDSLINPCKEQQLHIAMISSEAEHGTPIEV